MLYEGNEEPYIDLERGRTDAVLLDNIIADRYGCTDKHAGVSACPYDVARGTYVIGMRKGDTDAQARRSTPRSRRCAPTASSSGSCASATTCGTTARPRRRPALGMTDARQRTFDGAMLVPVPGRARS